MYQTLTIDVTMSYLSRTLDALHDSKLDRELSMDYLSADIDGFERDEVAQMKDDIEYVLTDLYGIPADEYEIILK